MLELESFKGQSFNDIFNLALNQARTLDNEWDNQQLYDPGVTLLELFSWLKVIQVKRMSVIPKETVLQLLKLLDIYPKFNKPSETLIKLDGAEEDVVVPIGTKWKADDLVFENELPMVALSAKIEELQFENPENFATQKYSEIDSRMSHEIFGNKLSRLHKMARTFTICFDKALPSDVWASIYFDVETKADKRRNPITKYDDFVEMADIQWEYYGVKDDEEGWHTVENMEDKTHRFLFSDIISFKIAGEMKECEGFYKLRATLKKSCYDKIPILKNLSLNVMPVVQKDTVCERVVFKKKDIEDGGKVVLLSHLALHGQKSVFVAQKDKSWVECLDFVTQSFNDTNETHIRIDDLQDNLDNYADDDDVVMVIAYLPDRMPSGSMDFATSSGLTSQVIDFECGDIYYEKFDLMIDKLENNKLSSDVWTKANTFFSSTKHDKHYVLDWEENRIVFGDNERGKIPDALINGIKIASLVYTRGKNSNIKSHCINEVQTNCKGVKALKIDQITAAKGGKDSETYREMLSRPIKMLSEINRAVTYDDYETIVRNTPGLIIDNVKILPGYLKDKREEECNCVTIAIQKSDDLLSKGKQDESYVENYAANIKKYLDKYRLINTRIEVIGVCYVGVTITADVTINSYEEECQKDIQNGIERFLRRLNYGLGKTLRYGDLFGAIEQLECVAKLENLRITPSGDYKKVDKSDDIIVKPNASYYIDSIEMRYLKNTNI